VLLTVSPFSKNFFYLSLCRNHFLLFSDTVWFITTPYLLVFLLLFLWRLYSFFVTSVRGVTVK
jgi:hypothetical protein